MNREQYLKTLNKKLKGLPADDKEDAIRFYEDYIAEAGLENSNDIETVLGTPEDVARNILDECMEKQISAQSKEATFKNNTKTIWMILLGIFAAPLAFPVIMVAVVLFLCLIIVMFSIDISVLALGFSFVVVAVSLIPAIIWANGIGQKLILLGMLFLSISLAILICIAFYKLGGIMVRGVVCLHHQFLGKRRNKNNNEEYYVRKEYYKDMERKEEE